MANEHNPWVRDDEKTRGFDGKKIFIERRGVFLMHVVETGADGERRPGYVQVLLEPCDLDVTPKAIDLGT